MIDADAVGGAAKFINDRPASIQSGRRAVAVAWNMTMAEENLCESCAALCCRYIALPIDNPETPREYDNVRWYLMHENIVVFVEDEQWYLGVFSRCKHLQPDNRCGVYLTRPRICRGYNTDRCDYHGGDYNYTELFTSADQLRVYAEKQLGRPLPLKVRTRPKKAKRKNGKLTLELPVV